MTPKEHFERARALHEKGDYDAAWDELVIANGLVRATRDALLPLWAAEIGLGPAETSLIFAASSAIDLTLFYLGGSMMDRLGRRAVAVPAMVIMGAAFGLLPLTATAAGLTAIKRDGIRILAKGEIKSAVKLNVTGASASAVVSAADFCTQIASIFYSFSAATAAALSSSSSNISGSASCKVCKSLIMSGMSPA